MTRIETLQAKLKLLQTEAAQIRAEGDCLQGVRLEKAAAGGTASKGSQSIYKYARLRCGKGKLLPGGMRSKYIPLKEITDYEWAIARGKRLTKLERQISQLLLKVDTATD